MIKGCICLDIDGTITSDPFHIPLEVVHCLESLYLQGWQILFSTGRPFAFASRLFGSISFPFFLSLQNGADLIKMPEKIKLAQEYLSSEFISRLEGVYQDMEEDFLVYSGWEKGDFCTFRPHRFSLKMLEHLEVVQALSSEPWKSVEEFTFSKEETFPLIKGLGTKEQMEKLSCKLSVFSDIHSTCIYDPLSKNGSYLNLITSAKATKGEVLKKLRALFPEKAFFIAAGDDFNDVSMFKEADKVIVMKTANQELWSFADILAEPAKENGIIEALREATRGVL